MGWNISEMFLGLEVVGVEGIEGSGNWEWDLGRSWEIVGKWGVSDGWCW
jgi:hypothetical protein